MNNGRHLARACVRAVIFVLCAGAVVNCTASGAALAFGVAAQQPGGPHSGVLAADRRQEPVLRLSLTPAEQAVTPGAALALRVVVSTSVPLRTLQCSLRFDPAVIEATSFQAGRFFADWAEAHGGTAMVFPEPPPIDNVQGKAGVVSISIMGGGAGGPVGSGEFGTFHLQVKDTAGSQRTTLRLEDVVAGDADLEPVADVGLGEAAIDVHGGSAEPTVTPGVPGGRLSVALIPAEHSAAPGEAMAVRVVLSSEVPLRTFQCGLRFDPGVIEAQGFQAGRFFADWAEAHGGTALVFPDPPPIDNSTGKAGVVSISIMGGQAGGPVGSGDFGTFQLRVRPDAAAGRSTLSLNDVVAGDADLEPVPDVGLADAVVVVSGGSVVETPTATATTRLTPLPTATPVAAALRIYLPFAKK